MLISSLPYQPSGAKTASPSVVADLVSYFAKPESHFITGALCIARLAYAYSTRIYPAS